MTLNQQVADTANVHLLVLVYSRETAKDSQEAVPENVEIQEIAWRSS